jgi:uncharacterized protein YbjQ (UPF0145 family)
MMVELRHGAAWGSALSADGFAAIRSVGFEPAGPEFGAAVYQLGAIAGASCPGTGDRFADTSPGAPGTTTFTVASGHDIPGPAARVAQALYEGRQAAIDRMTAECADLGGHGVVGASVQVREIPADALWAGAVEFKVIGTAVRAGGCLPLARPFASDLSGQDFAKLVIAGWVPAGIAFGISAAGLHDDGQATGARLRGAGNTEVPAYTDLMVEVRQGARSRLEQAVRGLGADGVVVSGMTLSVRADPCAGAARIISQRRSSPEPP